MSKLLKIGVGILIVAVIISVSITLLRNKNNSVANILDPLGVRESIVPTPTPFPFEEMTVPYLRSRPYQSTLGNLTKSYENSLYTAYLTSYTSDGLKVNGLLTIPKNGSEKKPAIVFIHGYIPPTLYKTTEKYYDYVDFLARNGFVVFKIDLRGHGSSEGEAGGGYYSSDYVIDALNARAALSASPFVDPARIGLWGHSMAGNVVARSLAAQPKIPAAVIWAGAGYTYTDLQEYRITDNSYRPPATNTQRENRRRELFNKYGQFTPDSWFWKLVVPTNYLSDIKGAIAIHHAVDDEVVGVEYTRNFMKLLDGTNIPHESHEYLSGGHNLSGSSFTAAMNRTVEFFKKYL